MHHVNLCSLILVSLLLLSFDSSAMLVKPPPLKTKQWMRNFYRSKRLNARAEDKYGATYQELKLDSSRDYSSKNGPGLWDAFDLFLSHKKLGERAFSNHDGENIRITNDKYIIHKDSVVGGGVFEVHKNKNPRYTGILASGAHVLIRISDATNENKIGITLWFFIDDHEPVNGFFMARLSKLEGSFIDYEFSNILPEEDTGIMGKVLSWSFSKAAASQDQFGNTKWLSNELLSKRQQDGSFESEPKFPFKLILQPHIQLKDRIGPSWKNYGSIKQLAEHGLLRQNDSLILFDVYAQEEDSDKIPIGQIKLNDDFFVPGENVRIHAKHPPLIEKNRQNKINRE